MVKRLLQKVGFIPHDYLHQSRAKVRILKDEVTSLNGSVTNLKKDNKALRQKISKAQTPTFIKTKLQNWAKGVKKHRICDICEETKDSMSAHHLWAKSLHPTLAYERANGVCLCVECHNKYTTNILILKTVIHKHITNSKKTNKRRYA